MNKLVVAAPISGQEMEDELKKLADEVVILEKPSSFYSVGQGYEDFDNLSDEQTTGFIDQWNNENLKKVS